MSGADFPLVLEPVTQQFVDLFAGTPPLRTFLPDEPRVTQIRTEAKPIGRPRATTEDLVFPVGPTGSVEVRIVRPPGVTAALPTVMLFHGGGSIVGDKETHDPLMREIAVGVGAAVIFVCCDRAPASRFPIAIEQAYAATKYAVDQARTLNIDASRLAVLGGGIGGNVAAVVALLAKQRRAPKIDLQVLLYPATGANFSTPSYVRFADGPLLTRAAMMWFWNAYLPDPIDRLDCRATPLNATIDQLRNLPDAFVVVAEGDVLRDEGEAYARKLSDAGVRVTSVRYNGTIHDFVVLHALADTPAARSAITQTICALRATFD